ncbi:MAG: histidinol-phosphatase [Clostridia bacterium]|nr:histidinol-phosphatase [Clostridia bacterium]
MIANYHSHTHRCHHATGTEREYIETAIARGLKILGFSDHTPMIFPTDEYYSDFRMHPEQLEDYVRTLSDLRDEYKNDIEIHIGLEVEYYPALFNRLMEFLSDYPIEYMILGQHFVDNEYDTHFHSSHIKDRADCLTKYVDQLLEAAATGRFLYMAHPDLCRYTGDPDIWEKEYRRLAEGAKKIGIPLEINFLGLRDNRHYPSERFNQIVAEVGNPVIFGCDAHQVDAVANPDTLKKAEEFAARFGFTPLETLPFPENPIKR